jgi:hypothetical protein
MNQWHLPGNRDLAVSAVAWSPDGKLVAWAGTDTRAVDDETKAPPPHRGLPALHVLDTTAGGAERLSIVLPRAPHALAFVFGQDSVITADAATVACYEFPAGRERWRQPLRRTDREPAPLASARTVPAIAVTLAPHTVSLLDPASGEATLTLTQPQERTIQAMDLTPDGTRLLALTGNLVQLWRIDVLQHELEEHLNGQASGVRHSD